MRPNKENKTQIIILIFLIVCAISLTIGFAAYSSNLVINSSAEVSPVTNTFDIVFSKSNTSVVSGSINGNITGSGVITASVAIIDNTTITGLKANCTLLFEKFL